MQSTLVGVYIHIPFCVSRCRYCDFFSTTSLDQRHTYISALIEEWSSLYAHLQAKDIQTIYFGGGTPSLIDIADLQRLLHSIPTLHASEITLEANPGDITYDKAMQWRTLGINRLSIGVQTFNDELLQRIGRRHTAQQAIQAVQFAQQAGFDNISIDIMYGLPTTPHIDPRAQLSITQQDIATALQLNVQHISTYCLSYEENTPLYSMIQRGELQEIDEDTENEMYDYIVDQLTQAGFEHYEVSNFALPNYHAQHNANYWNDTPYIGLGAGAHSYDGNKRSWNVSDLNQYILQATAHNLQPEQEILTPQQHHTEKIMLGLRTANGVDTADIDMAIAKPYIQQGLLQQRGNNITATTRGYHILNRIIEDLI